MQIDTHTPVTGASAAPGPLKWPLTIIVASANPESFFYVATSGSECSSSSSNNLQVAGRFTVGSDGGDGGKRAGRLLARAVQGAEAARHEAEEGQGGRHVEPTEVDRQGGRHHEPTEVDRRPAAVDRTTQLVHEHSSAGQHRKHAPADHVHSGPNERVQGE